VKRLLLIAIAALAFAAPATASPYLQAGIQDDAWLRFGPGTLADRTDELRTLGVDVVRYTLNWRELEPERGVYDWRSADEVLGALHDEKIGVVATLWGSPKWANGGRAPNWAPTSKWTFAAFARAAAKRYPYVKKWLVWNEPNKAPFLRPTSAKVYVQKLLNPAYAAIHNVERGAKIGGGVTGPVAGRGGISPVDFIRSMQRHHAKLDAYAHNPYPAYPRKETPFAGGCGHCATITMATIDKLLALTGRKRIWLTEYAYQTNDPYLGVSRARQATFVSQAALRAYELPRVDVLIHYMVRDDSEPGGWQSGLFGAHGSAKPSYTAFRFPTAGRNGRLWGQVRPRGGRQPYRLQRRVRGRWVWYGPLRRTNVRGAFSVDVPRGTYRVWSPRDREFGRAAVVRR
jgi:hypothetical protein